MEQLRRHRDQPTFLEKVRSRLAAGRDGAPAHSAEGSAHAGGPVFAGKKGSRRRAPYVPTRATALADSAALLDVAAVHRALETEFACGSWFACESLLTDAARLLGDRWSDDLCTFMDVTLSVALLHRAYRNALPDDEPTHQEGRIVLTAAPGAQHTLGMSLTAARLRRAGWEVEMGWPFSSTRRALLRGQDAVGVSVSGPRDYLWASEWSERHRDRRPRSTLVFGGWGATGLRSDHGVTGWGPGRDALEA